jgi:hypothetical protein
MYDEERLTVLLQPPRGSPSYAWASSLEYDDSSLPWSPRPADETERERLQEVRDMQALVRSHLGSRTDPTTQDAKAILTQFGANWPEKAKVYQIAINTMDRGVQVS